MTTDAPCHTLHYQPPLGWLPGPGPQQPAASAGFFETMRWQLDHFPLLAQHQQRWAAAIQCFALKGLDSALQALATTLPAQHLRVRVQAQVPPGGSPSLVAQAWPLQASWLHPPVGLLLLHHIELPGTWGLKPLPYAAYAQARQLALQAGEPELLVCSPVGIAREGSHSAFVYQMHDGTWCSPALGTGCVASTMLQVLRSQGLHIASTIHMAHAVQQSVVSAFFCNALGFRLVQRMGHRHLHTAPALSLLQPVLARLNPAR